MSNTIATQHVDLGMPVAERVRVSALRRLPVAAATAWDTCALVQDLDVVTFRSATDVVITGAFPGASAWSPPI